LTAFAQASYDAAFRSLVGGIVLLRQLRIFTIIAAFFGLGSNCFAGTISFGFFNSNAPFPTKTFAPGESFTVTLTAANVPTGRVLVLNLPLTLSGGSGQFQITGGTCLAENSYSTGNTCTVILQFLGNAPGTFNANLLGTCSAFAAAGGYSINCGNAVAGASGTLAALVGNGVSGAVNTLGKEGLALLLTSLLAIGAFFTLRRS
jgi:hypothetical protein